MLALRYETIKEQEWSRSPVWWRKQAWGDCRQVGRAQGELTWELKAWLEDWF